MDWVVNEFKICLSYAMIAWYLWSILSFRDNLSFRGLGITLVSESCDVLLCTTQFVLGYQKFSNLLFNLYVLIYNPLKWPCFLRNLSGWNSLFITSVCEFLIVFPYVGAV